MHAEGHAQNRHRPLFMYIDANPRFVATLVVFRVTLIADSLLNVVRFPFNSATR